MEGAFWMATFAGCRSTADFSEGCVMTYRIREARDEDAVAITGILNHYIRTSFAAYPSVETRPAFYSRTKALLGGHPFLVGTDGDAVVGFAVLRPFHPADTVRRTAELTCFIMPEHTGQGLGSQFLAELMSWAARHGIDNLLSSISSENGPSLAFHRSQGFVECGRMRRVGRKFDHDFDIVWMQRML
jgi:L-amino acid N-acyltransferase YncA